MGLSTTYSIWGFGGFRGLAYPLGNLDVSFFLYNPDIYIFRDRDKPQKPPNPQLRTNPK